MNLEQFQAVGYMASSTDIFWHMHEQIKENHENFKVADFSLRFQLVSICIQIGLIGTKL
jgi:hypothetical protein